MSGSSNDPSLQVDFLEAGSFGPAVMLVHSSVAGARQWRRLMDDLKDDFRVRAVNLFGTARRRRGRTNNGNRWTIRRDWSKRRSRQTPTKSIWSAIRSAVR